MRAATTLGALAFVLFACSHDPPSACDHGGCGAYHNQKFDDQGQRTATGTIEVTKPTRRNIDTSAGLAIEILPNGTLDVVQAEKVAYVPPAWCDAGAPDADAETTEASNDASDASTDADANEANDAAAAAPDAADAADAQPDARDVPDPECIAGVRTEKRTRAHVHLKMPSDSGSYDLDEVGAELWYCDSPTAEILPVAARDGSIVPGCFEAGKDFVPAYRDALDGKLKVFDPPVSLDDLRKEDSGFAFHYQITTSSSSPARVELDVSAWEKRLLTDCGDFY